jgi:signal transduction histidine kinase
VLSLVRADVRDGALVVSVEEAQRRQTAFLAMAAHELRRPLAPIRSAAAMLGRLDADDAGALARLQTIIERQVAHLSRLVDDLLDLSRADTGKLRLECSVVDLRDVIEAAVEACRPALVRRRQRLLVVVPPTPLEVEGDPVRLAQVVGNLLDNACKFTPDAGAIELLAALDGDLAVLSVADSGIGIAPAALAHVFEPFAQDVSSPGVDDSGLGLGLTLVSELVAAHGGCVVVHSAGAGTGSRFVVTLPLAPIVVAGRRAGIESEFSSPVPRSTPCIDDLSALAHRRGCM